MQRTLHTFFIIFVFIFLNLQFCWCEERAYVTNWESDNVSVIKISNNTIIDTVSTSYGPLGLAFTPDYKFVYIANYGLASCNNKVSVLRTSDNTIQCTITVGNCPSQVAITPDGNYAYVANYFSDNFSVIDISTNTVVCTKAIGNGPMGVTITPNGQYAYFTMEQEGKVKVVQTSNNNIVDTINVGSSPYRIAFTPNGAYGYVTNRFSNNVSVINTSNNTVIATIGVGSWPHGVAITPNGNYAYVVNFLMSNSVSVIQTSSNTVVATIPVGSFPKAIAFTLDGEYAYVTNGGGNSISVIKTSNNTVIQTIPVNSNPSGIIIGNCPTANGWIEGTVTLVGGTGNAENVIVTAGFTFTNPDSTGFYSIEIGPGTYDVTATLTGYTPQTIPNVLVEGGQVTGGINFTLNFTTGLNSQYNNITSVTKLIGNYPNPFNSQTTIGYQLSTKVYVTLKIFDMLGQEVRTLVNESQSIGCYSVIWDGKNELSESVASGVYFYQLKTNDEFLQTKKLLLIK